MTEGAGMIGGWEWQRGAGMTEGRGNDGGGGMTEGGGNDGGGGNDREGHFCRGLVEGEGVLIFFTPVPPCGTRSGRIWL